MKRTAGGLLLALLALGCTKPSAPYEPAAERSRVVVLGLDSVSWKMLDPLLDDGALPHLAALRDRGMSAEMTTVKPVISPPNWTSIATGRSPRAHGITSFFADRRHVRVPTVWERLSAAGLKVGVYDYLVTWPPRAVPGGFMIPGWLRRDSQVWPEDLFTSLDWTPHVYTVRDMGAPDEALALARLEIERKPDDFNRLAEAFDLDAAFVNFYAVDTVSHRFFHTYAPQAFDPPIPYDVAFEGVLIDTVRRLDGAVGKIVSALGENYHLVVISDHGSAPSDPVPRMWGFGTDEMLARAGLTDDAIQTLNGFVIASFKVEEGPAGEREQAIERLAAFAGSIRDAKGRNVFNVSVVREPAEALADGAIENPLHADAVAPNLPAYAFVFVAAVREVADALWPNGEVFIEGERASVKTFLAAHDFTGDHDPTAFFLAAGPAIAAGGERGRLSVLDVAPLVLYLRRPAHSRRPGGRSANFVLETRSPRRPAAPNDPGAGRSGPPAGPRRRFPSRVTKSSGDGCGALGYLQ